MGGQSGSWTPTKRRGPIAAEFQGPGPAAIGLPSLFGNINIKESSKQRAPAYTFGNRHERKHESSTPAPNAYNTSRLNPRGKDEPVAPSLHIKPKDPKQFVTPAPGAYNPDGADKDVKESAPKYSFGIKTKDGKPREVPAPNAYTISKSKDAPCYSLASRPKDAKKYVTPAPGAYEAVVVDDAPKHAFGIKHSPYIGALKGDDWVSARTEVISYPTSTTTTIQPAVAGPLTSSLVTNGHNNTEVKTSVIGGSNVTSNTRTHSDGHRIRTETFTYTKGPTVRTTTTTTSSGQVIQSSA